MDARASRPVMFPDALVVAGAFFAPIPVVNASSAAVFLLCRIASTSDFRDVALSARRFFLPHVLWLSWRFMLVLGSAMPGLDKQCATKQERCARPVVRRIVRASRRAIDQGMRRHGVPAVAAYCGVSRPSAPLHRSYAPFRASFGCKYANISCLPT